MFENKVLPNGFFDRLKKEITNEIVTSDSEYFTIKCKDSCIIRFRIDNDNLYLVAELPFIVSDFRGVYSRYIEVKERKYEKESLVLWVNFVVSIITRYDTGFFDTYKSDKFYYE